MKQRENTRHRMDLLNFNEIYLDALSIQTREYAYERLVQLTSKMKRKFTTDFLQRRISTNDCQIIKFTFLFRKII